MTKFRLCSFNIENLFTRFDFSAFSDPRAAAYLSPIVQFYGNFGDGDLTKFEEFKRFVQTAAISQDDDKRQHTALAIAEADAHVYCLQEVDGFDALVRFIEAYVKKTMGERFHNRVLHEGNDMRGIDVAAISVRNVPFYSRSHAWLTGSVIDDTESGQALLDQFPLAKARARQLRSQRVFRRDCLELEVIVGENKVSLFNCHFKSMGGRDPERSLATRQTEAILVRELITRKFADPAAALWAICGDLNDALEFRFVSSVENDDGSFTESPRGTPPSGEDGSALEVFLSDGFAVNLLDTLPEDERYTHYFAGGRSKTQLDYILASPALAGRVRGAPEVIRAGMPHRVPNLATPRYPRIGWDRPKASDHCPVVVEFDI
ncbi:endonuclease/exonuclease/phosphatase family protein [Gymnodinialimonas sp. 2305UL16-5]|uniref:endonuclease/exonuclease/phosphatase family protein n=1 Tax=Gymnodinialimonas mytili TaxID=3126503 RepID=UPI003099B558